LASSGVKEINIISHDFTDYGWDLRRKDDTRVESPAELLRQISEVKGLEWIRVLYLYPDGITREMVQLIKERKNLVKYFDMPLQHINNDMLKKMNRKMTKEKIVGVLNMIREEIPEAVIRTQFIVGFPGETNEQFEELLAFVKEQKFDRVGCFQYSPEEGTAGGKMLDQLDEKTKEERFHKLMSAQLPISRKNHKKLVGTVVDVVVEGVSEESELLLKGRTSQQAPDIDGIVYINEGSAKVGDIVKVEITDSMEYDLIGSIVETN
jgi:ribosomal protein S12 methylthiotransferase